MLALITANVRRRKLRTGLTAAGIAVGVAAIVALLALSSGLNQTAGQLVHLGRADFSVFQRGAADPTSSTLPLALAPRIRAQPGIAQVAPMQLVTQAVAQEPGAVLMGVDPAGFVARYLVVISGTGIGPGRVDLGNLLARQLHARAGSRVRLGGRRFVVAGIVHSGIPEQDSGVMTTLADAQALAGRTADEVSNFAVRLNAVTGTARATRQLSRRFPSLLIISSASEAVRLGANGALISKAVLLIGVLALIIGALAVANTMVAAVLERRREIAVLATIGWDGPQLAWLVIGEAVIVSVLGTAAGLALGILASKLLPGALGLGDFISPRLTAPDLGEAILIGIIIGIVGAAYPAWRVTRMRSTIALAAT